MFPPEWDPHVLDLPLYQRDNGDLIGGIEFQRQQLRQHRAVCQNGTLVFFLQNHVPTPCTVKNEERRPRLSRSIEDDGIEGTPWVKCQSRPGPEPSNLLALSANFFALSLSNVVASFLRSTPDKEKGSVVKRPRQIPINSLVFVKPELIEKP